MTRPPILAAIGIALTLTSRGCSASPPRSGGFRDGLPTCPPTIEAAPSGPVQERIRRVENGLIAVTAERELEWGDPKTLAERMEHYTIQQLLEAQPPADDGSPTRVTRVPGTAYEYSNLGYGVVQLLMTDVTHQPFSELMQETVLGPVGMTSSTFEQPLPQEFRDRATTEHYVNGQPFEGKRHHFPLLARVRNFDSRTRAAPGAPPASSGYTPKRGRGRSS